MKVVIVRKAWLVASSAVVGVALAEEDMVIKLVPDWKSGGMSEASLPSYSELWSAASDEMPWVIALRRELHRSPELMYNETGTTSKIASVLESLGIEYERGWAVNTKHAELAAKGFGSGAGGTGIVAEIGTGRPPCVLLRADIDALPIAEATSVGLPFASEVAGKSHACGHDGHAAMLLGAAALLKKREASINGTVRMIWQPAEEGGAGGLRMVEEGVLRKEPEPGAAFAFHQWPFMPIGEIGGRPGTQMAATDLFDIDVSGVGGHAAMPHATVDPIVAASAVVTALQTVASRETSPLDAAVVSVTQFHAGAAYNVIPAGASIGGTIRSLTKPGLLRLKERVEAIVLATAAAHQCNASISWAPDPYPPTANDPALFDWVTNVAAQASVTNKIDLIQPTMGGEDFAFIAERLPSVFLALGSGHPNWPAPPDLDLPKGTTFDTTVTVHSPLFVLNEDVIQRGTALHAHLALHWLAAGPNTRPGAGANLQRSAQPS